MPPHISLPDTVWSPALEVDCTALHPEQIEKAQTIAHSLATIDDQSLDLLHQKLILLEKIVQTPFASPEQGKKKVAPYYPALIEVVEKYIAYTNKRVRD